MVKKGKDTLNKLNQFLQSSGSEKESPSASPTTDYLKKKPTQLVEFAEVEKELKHIYDLPDGQLKEDDIADFIRIVALSNKIRIRQVLYSVIEKTLDKLPQKDSTDLMLINTIAYLKYHDWLNGKMEE